MTPASRHPRLERARRATRRGRGVPGVALAGLLVGLLVVTVACRSSGGAADEAASTASAPEATTTGSDLARETAGASSTGTATTTPPVTAGSTIAAATTGDSTTTTTPPEVGCEPTLTVEEQVALLVWPSVYSSDWETARRVVSENGLGGVLLMEPSGWDAETIAARLARLESESAHGLLVATDEEGGDVQRLAGVSPLASQRDVSAAMSPSEASTRISEHAAIVRGLGIDVVFAPVVDVLPAEGSPPLRRSRFFDGGPEQVAAYGSAYVEGWQRAGILPVLKHFPGHGRASGDTHTGDGVTAPLADLETWDLVPYRLLADSGAGVMVGHLTTPGLSDGLPASRSPGAVGFLRDEVGFADALVVSDSLDMDAVGVPVPQAAVESIAAGVDVVLFTDPSITGAVLDAVEGAVAEEVIPEDRITDAARKVWALLDGAGDLC